MCGVIGFSGRKSYRLGELMWQSRVRGLHAFGFTWRPDGSNLKTEIFTKYDDAARAVEKARGPLIYHNRYATSGEANQPIQIGDRAIAFNGIVSMKDKRGMEEEFGIKMQTDNDAELVLRLGFKVMKSFAGLLIDPMEIHVYRNKFRPLWYCREPEGTYVASTEDIFMRAGFSAMKMVPPDQLLDINELY